MRGSSTRNFLSFFAYKATIRNSRSFSAPLFLHVGETPVVTTCVHENEKRQRNNKFIRG